MRKALSSGSRAALLIRVSTVIILVWAIALGPVALVLFSTFPNLVFRLSDSEHPVWDLTFYQIVEFPLFSLLPLSLGLGLIARNKVRTFALIALCLAFIVPFSLMAPVFAVERSYMLPAHCYNATISFTEWQSITFHFFGFGARYKPSPILCF